ncbi:MAG: LacI family DNA-binding transcriptional regulator [Lachnospiraceae bacterium]|nr:LacI family DNA-binding transcriptional regulator [Lachnospiraceae bacterium]
MTIKQVAEIAGVSPAAISRYINGGSLSAEKKEIIREAIEKTGYRPNMMAQTMRTGRGGEIGVIVPKIYSDSVSQIVGGITERLREKNYLTMLGTTDGHRERELRYLELMQNSQVAGIILMGTVMTPLLEDAISNSTKPVVVTGQNFKNVACVYHDDFHAVYELMARMIRKGRRHTAYIGVTQEDEAAGKERSRGALAAFRDAGGEESSFRQEIASAFTPEAGREAMERILHRYPDTDGVVCATDMIAHGAMMAIRAAGRRVPEDMGIAGVGDSWADAVAATPLTTAHLYYRQCGITATDMLLRMINHEDSPQMKTMLEFTITERGSL